ncbi:Alpha/Beta hydrolase protein [Mycena olivaceomarginata]|nr:Alpha/Beta hydrolase protein [Mycena olivaceomarginata]
MSSTDALGLPSSNSKTLVPKLPFLRRLKYTLSAFALQNFLVKPFAFFKGWKDYLLPPQIRADVVKTYASRPRLPIRVFFPWSSKPSSKLPALFVIHGGGFVIGSSTDNESWNRKFADTNNMIVVALNYSKAPRSPFPKPIHDVEALFVSAISDSSLPIDPTRVAMAGWSAGGNLALAASQLESVRSRLRAIVPLYPVVDFTVDLATKLRLRQYKPALGGFRGRPTEMLASMASLFDWSYIPAGTDCRNPLLSPLFASRDTLPKTHISEVAGMGEFILEDERFHFEATTSDGGTYRWLLVPDAIHGFDESRISDLARDAEMGEDMAIKKDKAIAMIGEWLLAGPLKH